ncbi:MAG: RadC family protein [Rhodospirillales bacterium]
MKPPAAKPHDHNAGHRERVRARFDKIGAEALEDYELLEMMLFWVIPRGDTKPLAKNLLKKFGSFAGVMHADMAEIAGVIGAGPATARFFTDMRAAALRMAQDELMHRPVLSNWAALVDYCKARMGPDKQESFRLLFLDRKNNLMADEEQQRGTVDHTPVYPREVIKRALELEAAAIIMVHNHPSGDPTPSKADVEMTREVKDAAAKMSIALHDHIVVARGGVASMKEMGLL